MARADAHLDGDHIVFDGQTVGRVSPGVFPTLRDRFESHLETGHELSFDGLYKSLEQTAKESAGLLTLEEVKDAIKQEFPA